MGQRWSGDGQFMAVADVAVDASGNDFVGDQQRVQKFTSTGTYLGYVGSAGSGDGQFALPTGIALDGSGSLFVVDYLANRVQKFACP